MRKDILLTPAQHRSQFIWVDLELSVGGVANLVLLGDRLSVLVEFRVVGDGVEGLEVGEGLEELV